ncbi:MAG: Ig-like domain-containing protein, partial [Alphaproteobacteria bacterium]
ITGDHTITASEDMTPTVLTTADLGAFDPDDVDNAVTFTVTGSPANGALSASSFTLADIIAGTVTYTHDGGETSSDSFTVQVSDDDPATGGTATINIGITNVNDAPAITGDHTITASEDMTPTVLTTADLGAFDPDDADSAVTFTVTGSPSNGVLSASSFTLADIIAGTVSYTHDGGEASSDSFTVQVSDDEPSSGGTATINIGITPVNDAPVAVDDAFSDLAGFTYNPDNGHWYKWTDAELFWTDAAFAAFDEGGHLATITSQEENDFIQGLIGAGEIAWIGGDDIASEGTWQWSVGAEAGTVFWNGSPTGAYENWGPGEPNNGAGGNEDWLMIAADTGLWNDAPGNASMGYIVEVGDDILSDEDEISIVDTADLLANDFDIEGDTLTVTSVSATSAFGAAITLNGDGTITYDPTGAAALQSLEDGEFVVDSITYTITDGNGGFDTATVSGAIVGATDGPDAEDDTIVIDEEETIVIDVLANDSHPEGRPLTPIASTNPLHGFLTFDAGTNEYTYTANLDFAGTDSFEYTIVDDVGGQDTATVNITVNPVNDAPVFGGDHQVTVNQSGLVVLSTLDLSAFDPDDADVDVTFVLNGAPAGGSLTNGGVALSNGQSFTLADILSGDIAYDHAGATAADDSFIVELLDDDLASGGTATIDINVVSPPAPPVAVTDNYVISSTVNVFMDLTANDTDPNDDPLSPIASTNPVNGFLGFNGADETYFYIPTAGFTGTDSFTYTITDGNSGFDTGTVNISILADGDPLIGTAADEVLQGSSLDDTISGGGGDDLFQFDNGDGDDTVTDFTAGAGSDDRLDVSEFGFTDLADLLASTNDSGVDTVIDLDTDDSVTLIGVQKADLHDDDFLF